MNDSISTAVESIRVQPNLTLVTSAQPTAKQQMCVCGVCGDTKSTYNFLALIDCKYASEVYSAFYENWIVAVLDQMGLAKIRCPDADCGKLLGRAEVQQCIIPEIYTK